MKAIISLFVLTSVVFGSVSFAADGSAPSNPSPRIVSVGIVSAPTLPSGTIHELEVTAEVCGHYPSVDPNVTSLANNKALISLSLETSSCSAPTLATFNLPIDQLLRDLFLNPDTAQLFVQVQ